MFPYISVFFSNFKEVQRCSEGLIDQKLRGFLQSGVGYHHAGLDSGDRLVVEELFLSGNLPILVSTSTLAMGVNLPAHLVIVKSTTHMDNGEYKEYSEAQVGWFINKKRGQSFLRL